MIEAIVVGVALVVGLFWLMKRSTDAAAYDPGRRGPEGRMQSVIDMRNEAQK